jgi:hypothetical protein
MTTALVTMSDNVYRMALKAKVQLNHYDGTLSKIVDVLLSLFDAFQSENALIDIVDSQDMQISINVVKANINPILLALLEQRFLDTVAAGVSVNFVDGVFPSFGFDQSDALVKGWDRGHWSNEE